MATTAPLPAIRWPQIISLVGLDLAILISWIAYHEYQPKLLEQFKFTEFTLALAVLQGLILAATPPVAGLISDRMIQRGGNRLPVVTIGINFVSMVFMIVAVTVFVNPGGWIRFLFPVMVALWLVAMNIFHSPAISMVETFVPARRLPQVVAIFAILANATAALEPSIIDLITLFGAPITFAFGGTLVFLTGFWFVRSTKGMAAESGDEVAEERPAQSNLALVIGLGLLMGAATVFFFKLSPTWIAVQLKDMMPEGWTANYFASIFIMVAAVMAYPLGLLAGRIGAVKMALGSSALALLVFGGLAITVGVPALLLYVLYAVAFAGISVSFLPIAFGQLSRTQLVFGIGLFFSGVEIASSIWDIVQALPG
jgi:hypothetical protein